MQVKREPVLTAHTIFVHVN